MARRTASLRSSTMPPLLSVAVPRCSTLALATGVPSLLGVGRPARDRASRRASRTRDAGFTEVADRVWVARYAWFDVNVSVVGGDRAGCWWSTPTPSGAARPARWSSEVRRLGAGERGRGGQHPRALRPHLRQRGPARGVRRVPVHAHEDAAAGCARPRSRVQRRGRGERPTTRSRRGARRPGSCRGPHLLLGAVRRPRRPARRAGPPGPRPHRRRPGGPGADADVLLAGDLVEESACAVPGVRRRLLPAGVAGDAGPGAQPARPRTGRRARARRGRPGVRRTSSAATIGVVAETIRDLAAPRRAARGGARRAARVAVPARGLATRCAGATSSCRAAPASCRCLSRSAGQRLPGRPPAEQRPQPDGQQEQRQPCANTIRRPARRPGSAAPAGSGNRREPAGLTTRASGEPARSRPRGRRCGSGRSPNSGHEVRAGAGRAGLLEPLVVLLLVEPAGGEVLARAADGRALALGVADPDLPAAPACSASLTLSGSPSASRP